MSAYIISSNSGCDGSNNITINPTSIEHDVIRDIRRPSRIFTPFVTRVLLSIFLAVLIVMAVMKSISVVSTLCTILFSIMFYIMLVNMSGDNIAGSLPYATYPIPPHLGLDGISLANRSF